MNEPWPGGSGFNFAAKDIFLKALPKVSPAVALIVLLNSPVQAANYSWSKASLPEAFIADTDFASNYPVAAFKCWRGVVVSQNAADQAGFAVEYGSATIPIEFKRSGKFTVLHTGAPDYPPACHEVYSLETQGGSAALEAAFSKRASPK